MKTKKIDSTIDGVANKVRDGAHDAGDETEKVSTAGHHVVGQVKAALAGTAKEVIDKGQETAHKMAHGVQELATKTIHVASEVAEKATHAVQKATTKAKHTVPAPTDKGPDTAK
jgi:hypothetical protein